MRSISSIAVFETASPASYDERGITWPLLAPHAVLLYLSGCLVACTQLIEAEPIPLLRLCHIGMAGALILVLASRDFRRGFFSSYIKDWGAILLVMFLLYFIVLASIYPSARISAEYQKIWFSRLCAGLALGFVLLYATRTSKSSAGDTNFRWELSALGLALASLVWITARLLLICRSDIFLVQYRAGAPVIYQAFGDYLFLWYFCVAASARRLFAARNTLPALAARASVYLGLAVWTVFIAQVVGSNGAAIGIALLAVLMFGCDLFVGVRSIERRSKWAVGAVLAGTGVLGAALAVSIAISVPPLRMFNYEPFLRVAALDLASDSSDDIPPLTFVAGSSVSSRWKIIYEDAVDQLALDPMFGDLGAEVKTFRPGGYIHSLISVQSHTGLIGSMLLIGFLLSRAKVAWRTLGADDIPAVAFLIAVLLVALTARFFVWLPLWFAIGMLLALRGRVPPGERPLAQRRFALGLSGRRVPPGWPPL